MRKGTATFLPLNKMRQRPPMRYFKNQPGIIDYAINLVDYNLKYDAAFWYVFGDTLVVDTLETARRMAGTVRMVTLDGDVVEKSGAMTGVSGRSPSSSSRRPRKRGSGSSQSRSPCGVGAGYGLSKVESVDGHIYSLKKDRSELDSQVEAFVPRDEITYGPAGNPHPGKGSCDQLAKGRAPHAAGRDDPAGGRNSEGGRRHYNALSGDVKMEDELKGSEIPRLTEEPPASRKKCGVSKAASGT